MNRAVCMPKKNLILLLDGEIKKIISKLSRLGPKLSHLTSFETEQAGSKG